MLFLKRIRCVRPALILLGLGLVAAAAGQGAPLNVADNPIDLNGNYMCPGANGYARANTNPNDRFTLTQVVEKSGGIYAKSGTFTPFNDLTKWPARLAVDLNGKAFQFDIDLDATFPKVNWENAVFAIGAGDELGSSTAAAAQVEITRNGSTWDFKWRSGPGSTTPITTVTPNSPLPTQFRVRVIFNDRPSIAGMATVVITPLNNVAIPVDTVMTGLPVNESISDVPFVAGFQALDGMNTSRGHAFVTNFVTTAGPNAMWMMNPFAYKSTNQAAAPWALLPAQYVIGMSNPTERVHAWQAIIDPVNYFLNTDFSFGMPVFNMPMIAPFNGTLDNPTPPYWFLPRGVVRAGAFSIVGTPSGTEQSYFLGALNFNILDGENFQRPAFVATDPAGGPAPAITTLQGSGYTNIASNLREASGLIIDNTRPFTSQLKVLQDMSVNPAVLHQGPVTIMFRGEDLGLPAQFNLGSGLARYPRAVLRPVTNESNAAGLQMGDFDFSDKIYPLNDNNYVANLTIGTPGTLNVTCGKYRVVTWAEDRVGLISVPSTNGTIFSGYDGVTPTFEIRKFNSLTINLTVPGFSGSAPDPIHLFPPRFQRWVTVTIGGPSNGFGWFQPVTYERFVLLDSAGNGQIVLNAPDGLPCPGADMWVSVKDQQHSLRKTVPITLTPNTSNYTASVQLTLGDLNNDNRVGIGDFGIFLYNYAIIYSQNDITFAGFVSHSDLSGNRRVGVEDYMFIQNNNNVSGDNLVGNYIPARPLGGDELADRITVKKLLSMGVNEAKRYDFDGDGWVTLQEMQKVLQLKNARKW